jgi:hypothetical protein
VVVVVGLPFVVVVVEVVADGSPLMAGVQSSEDLNFSTVRDPN